MKFITFILTLLLSITTSASLLTAEGPYEKFEKSYLYASTTTAITGENIKLQSIGKGLRNKKIVFVNVKIYVAQLFVTAVDKFKRSEEEALASLKDQNAVAIQLHFMREIPAEKIQQSFKDALKANSVDLTENTITQFLSDIGKSGDAKESEKITLLTIHQKDGMETLYIEDTKGKISEIKGSAGLTEKIFSIWLGKPADDGITQLKKSLLK